MRREFASELLKHAKENKNIVLLTGDLGYGIWDEFRDQLPSQFINTGAAEQAMLDIAVGLALSGKIPFCYSISPFLIYRAFETIRTYIDHESINVKLIGSGREGSYAHEGFSHNSDDIPMFLNHLKNIEKYYPESAKYAVKLVSHLVESDKPAYVGLAK